MDAISGDAERTRRFFKEQDWSVAAIFRRYPATVLIGGIIVAVGFFTLTKNRAEMDVYQARFGLTWASLSHGRLWTMPISTVLQSDPGFPWIICFFSLTALFALETIAGSRATIVTFVASDWISAPLTAVALRLLAGLGDGRAAGLLDAGSTGSSAAFHGCYAAGIMLLPRRWAMRLMPVFLAIVVIEFLFERLDDSIAHAVAVLVGVLLARLIWARRTDASQRS